MTDRLYKFRTHLLQTSLAMVLLLSNTSGAADWTHWRGPDQNGISREKGLVDSWSLDTMENVLWVSDIGGRATPVIMNDRVYLNCRTHHDFNDPEQRVHIREQVVCWDLNTGDVIWRDEINVTQTDIPAPRVGWAAMVADPETRQVYFHSVCGTFRCYSDEGSLIWERDLLEEYGKISGYGGRTQTPIVDEDRVIVSFLATNWGETKGPAPLHYYYAFDKRTGDLQWVSAPGEAPKSTNQSCPIVTVIDGVRMLIGGNSDGHVYAMNARTGQRIWQFRMSLNGLNATPAIDGTLVYMSHGEDNIDNQEFGRVQCINGLGKGDITDTNSVWRLDGIKSGFSALMVHEGILYVVTDTGKLLALDSKTGEKLWEFVLGTVGKGSPVWADGKLYVMEVNGAIHILKPSRQKCESLSRVRLLARHGTGDDEIYASPAISNGRIVLVTRDRTICIGTPRPHEASRPVRWQEAPVVNEVANIQLRPYEVIIKPGQRISYTVHKFDANGRLIDVEPATLTAGDGLGDLIVQGDTIVAPINGSHAAGTVSAQVGELTAAARVRMFDTEPVWEWDFSGYTAAQVPPQWLKAFGKLKPVELDGNVVMMAAGIGSARGRPSHAVWLGAPDMKDYTVQADVMLTEQRRQMSDIGLIANKYNLILRGNTGKLRIQCWAPHLRIGEETSFRSDPNVWYTMKLKVEIDGGEATIYGKVWKVGEPEPESWTIQASDPHPNHIGSPGLYVYATTDCYFDNVVVHLDDPAPAVLR